MNGPGLPRTGPGSPSSTTGRGSFWGTAGAEVLEIDPKAGRGGLALRRRRGSSRRPAASSRCSRQRQRPRSPRPAAAEVFEVTRAGRLAWEWTPPYPPVRAVRVAADFCPQLAKLVRRRPPRALHRTPSPWRSPRLSLRRPGLLPLRPPGLAARRRRRRRGSGPSSKDEERLPHPDPPGRGQGPDRLRRRPRPPPRRRPHRPAHPASPSASALPPRPPRRTPRTPPGTAPILLHTDTVGLDGPAWPPARRSRARRLRAPDGRALRRDRRRRPHPPPPTRPLRLLGAALHRRRGRSSPGRRWGRRRDAGSRPGRSHPRRAGGPPSALESARLYPIDAGRQDLVGSVQVSRTARPHGVGLATLPR